MDDSPRGSYVAPMSNQPDAHGPSRHSFSEDFRYGDGKKPEPWRKMKNHDLHLLQDVLGQASFTSASIKCICFKADFVNTTDSS